MRPLASKYPVPKVAISLFMQGETAEFGPEAQHRRATISSASHIIRVEQPKTTTGGGNGTADPKDAGVPGQYPPPFMSCAVNPDCPDTYCRPFDTLKQALADRTSDGKSVLSTIATANPHAEPLFRRYVFSPGPAGDISAEYGLDFASSRTTRYVSEQIHRLVEADIKSNPPTFPLPIAGPRWTTKPTAAKTLSSSSSINWPPAAWSTLIRSRSRGSLPGASAPIRASVPWEPIPRGRRKTAVRPGLCPGVQEHRRLHDHQPHCELHRRRPLDFCPGNCGGFFARHLGNTVQMSRWEASGISGDVPFTVNFQGPPLIGAYNSED